MNLKQKLACLELRQLLVIYLASFVRHKIYSRDDVLLDCYLAHDAALVTLRQAVVEGFQQLNVQLDSELTFLFLGKRSEETQDLVLVQVFLVATLDFLHELRLLLLNPPNLLIELSLDFNDVTVFQLLPQEIAFIELYLFALLVQLQIRKDRQVSDAEVVRNLLQALKYLSLVVKVVAERSA